MKRNMKLAATGVALAFCAAVQTGCAGPATATSNSPQLALPEAAVKIAQPPESRPSGIAGKVVETVNAGGYTYIELEGADKILFWAAVPLTKVTAGEEVEIRPGMRMDNFTSKALNMTFETIIFSEGIVPKK